MRAFVLTWTENARAHEWLVTRRSAPAALRDVPDELLAVDLEHRRGCYPAWSGGVAEPALAGLAAETGIVMLAYLDEVYERRRREGRLNTMTDLYEGIVEGAVLRVRPKLMTITHVDTSTAVGADVRALAALGGRLIGFRSPVSPEAEQ